MYETKVFLAALSEIIVKSKDVKEVYQAVKRMANVEGLVLKDFEEFKKEVEQAD